jgi:chromosome segregation protein
VFLRSLTLKGFKSFAEPTTLEFEPGLTVVVGPNGSGKSNIVDAVAWVLGAQGPRTVRSSRMEDVIFAGNGRRAPLGRAEVSLTIDNSSHILPIGFTEVTVTRTLWRSSGESEYAINGVACRLLDVQELLSDSGVGRQQHVIVSQGNLDSVLDARPEERRLVIEEAAGILKFRRRKEKAERRLEASEANLVRLGDLLREVRRQMRPLERQAEAARRHGEATAELQALRLHLAGRTIAGLQARVEAAARQRAQLDGDESSVRAALVRLDESVAAAESRLGAADGSALGDAAGRLEALRERARGLVALVADRARSLAAALAVEGDERVATLEEAAAALAGELAAVEEGLAALGPEGEALAVEEAALARRREALAARAARDQEAQRVAEARGRLAALQAAADRGRAELDELAGRLGGLEERERATAAALERARAVLAGADAAASATAAGVKEAAAAVAAAEADLSAAAAAARAAAADRAGWEARAEGLALAAVPAAGDLAHAPGVVGPLLDLLDVDPGWEAAVEAALADSLSALVVDGPDAARRAFAGAPPARARFSLAGARRHAPPPRQRSLREHVRGRNPAVDELLDDLLAGVVAVDGGWEDAADLALAEPDLVVVTRRGDRFAPSGWRVAPAGGGVAAALAEARARAAAAGEAWMAAAAAERAAEEVLRASRSRLTEARAASEEADQARGGARAAAARLEGEHGHAAADLAAARRHRDEREQRAADDRRRVAETETWLAAHGATPPGPAPGPAPGPGPGTAPGTAPGPAPGTGPGTAPGPAPGPAPGTAPGPGPGTAPGTAPGPGPGTAPGTAPVPAPGTAPGSAFGGDVRAEREAVARLGDELAGRRTRLAARSAELGERQVQLGRRLAEVEARLAAARAERAAAEQLAAERRTTLVRTERLGAHLAGLLATLDTQACDLRERRRRHGEWVRSLAERLEQLRRERAAAERRLEEVRELARRAELDEAEGRMRLEAAVESLRRDHDCEPDAAVASPCPPLPPGTSPPNRVRELERELRLMGPVNPLAVEELAALQERHDFLVAQLEDVKASRRDLAKLIRSVEAEMTTLLAAAYADVAENFTLLFETLFPGGQGRLRLTEPDRLLESGIEIEARPGGKSPRKLSLLSGGERSLCAMAFLFAVFRSRPSPFYLLDEVEAALDDVNLHRFLRLLDEFRTEAQLLVVTHQKRTMEAADCLYGVTMPPGGSSRVLSERVRAAT